MKGKNIVYGIEGDDKKRKRRLLNINDLQNVFIDE